MRGFILAFCLCVLCVLCGSIAEAATLTPTTMSRAGVSFTSASVAASGGGDKFLNDSVSFLWIKNGGGSSITVTLTWGTGGTVDGQTPTARTVTINAGDSQVIGPFNPNFYNDANGFMNWTYSGVTSVTIAVIHPGS